MSSPFLSCIYFQFSSSTFVCQIWHTIFTKAPFTHRRLGRRFMAIRHSAMLREERVSTVFNPQVIRHSSAVIREDRGEPPENLTKFNFYGGLKWNVFIRVRNAVHRVKNALVRDNTVLHRRYPPDVTRCYHGCWRSLHGERRCEREWTRSISNRHEKLNMFNFSCDRRGLKMDRAHSRHHPPVPARCRHGRWRSLRGERRCEREWTRSISNRQEKLIGDFRNVFKLMDISSA